LNRGLACLALAGLAALPRSLYSQSAPPGVPEALKESALAVRVLAVVTAPPVAGLQAPDSSAPDGAPSAPASASTKDKSPEWQVGGMKYTVPGTPVPFKFVGANITILVQVTPFSRRDSQGIVLVTQGQVWIKNKEGDISYRTAINTLSVNYGEKVFFFPLGVDSSGKAPLRLEIAVLRAADAKEQQTEVPQSSEDKGGGSGDGKAVPGDKAGAGDKAPGDKAAPVDKPSK
jgi:hypothetical protein